MSVIERVVKTLTGVIVLEKVTVNVLITKLVGVGLMLVCVVLAVTVIVDAEIAATKPADVTAVR